MSIFINIRILIKTLTKHPFHSNVINADNINKYIKYQF